MRSQDIKVLKTSTEGKSPGHWNEFYIPVWMGKGEDKPEGALTIVEAKQVLSNKGVSEEDMLKVLMGENHTDRMKIVELDDGMAMVRTTNRNCGDVMSIRDLFVRIREQQEPKIQAWNNPGGFSLEADKPTFKILNGKQTISNKSAEKPIEPITMLAQMRLSPRERELERAPVVINDVALFCVLSALHTPRDPRTPFNDPTVLWLGRWRNSLSLWPIDERWDVPLVYGTRCDSITQFLSHEQQLILQLAWLKALSEMQNYCSVQGDLAVGKEKIFRPLVELCPLTYYLSAVLKPGDHSKIVTAIDQLLELTRLNAGWRANESPLTDEILVAMTLSRMCKNFLDDDTRWSTFFKPAEEKDMAELLSFFDPDHSPKTFLKRKHEAELRRRQSATA